MNKYILTALLVLILVGVGWNTVHLQKEQDSLGSVSVSSEYHATTTGETTQNSSLTEKLLKGGPGVLGQVTLTGAQTGRIFLYNATTSDNELRADVSTTTLLIAFIEESQVEGTYIFDAQFISGLLLITEGTQPTTTITYR